MGGDEFVFLLTAVRKDDAARIAAEIVDFIKNRVVTPEGKNITFSVGAKIVEYGSKDFFEKVDNEADVAARLAKSQRNRIEIYDEKTFAALENLLKDKYFIQQELGKALARVIGEPNKEEVKLISLLAEEETEKRKI